MQGMLCVLICSLRTVSALTYIACMRILSKQQAYLVQCSGFCLLCNLLPSFRSVCPDATSDVRQMILHAGGVHTDDFMG